MVALLRELTGRRQERPPAVDAAPRDHLARVVEAFEQAGLPVRRGGVAPSGSRHPQQPPREQEAQPGEILVSRTVRDLVAGSEVDDRWS